MRWILILLCLWGAMVLTPLAIAQNLSGTYTFQGTQGPITLQLQSEDGGLAGTLKGGTLALTLSGFPREDGSFLGAATDANGEFASYFVVSRAPGQILLDLVEANDDGDPNFAASRRITFATKSVAKAPSSEQALQKARQIAGKSNPRSQTQPATNPASKNSKTPVRPAPRPGEAPGSERGAAWKTYRHATGLMLRYPPNWSVQNTDGVLLFKPPGASADEVYAVKGEPANGMSDPMDEQVGTYLDSQMAQLAPFLTRGNAPKSLHAATSPGALYTWEGTNPRGQKVRAQVRVTFLKGFALALVSLGTPAQIAPRSETLDGIFSSLAAGVGQRDPQIVGSWKFWSYKSSANGKYGVETKRSLQLLADGTAIWGSESESSGNFSGKDAGGNTTWTGGMAHQSGDSDRGTWSAAQGELFIQWNDGKTGNWDYRVQGARPSRKLFLKGAAPQPEEWMEAN